jgi:transcription initiation factor TFIIF subunit beta
MRLLLAERAEHQGIEREYDMDITNMNVSNTFVFAEQDLPSFKAQNKARQEAAAAGIPAHLLRAKVEKPAQTDNNGKRRGKQEYFRKAIPSKDPLPRSLSS